MTDLERLWDALPTGPAPTDPILRSARRAAMAQEAAVAAAEQEVRRARRRRLAGRPLVAALVVTALAAAFAIGAGVGGPFGRSGPGAGGGSGQPRPAAFQADLKPATSCDALLAAYRQRGLRLVSPWGWQQEPYLGLRKGLLPPTAAHAPAASSSFDGVAGVRDSPAYADRALTAGTSAKTVRQNSSATGTNVQESGVDEPDTVKTDGRVLAQVHDDELWLYDVSGSRVRRLSSVPVDAVDGAQLLLSGHTLVVVGGDADAEHPAATTRVLTLDITDPRSPRQVGDVVYHAALLSARQHGSAIRLVLDAGLPDLGFVQPHRGVSVQQALRRNRAVVRRSTIADWIPTYAAAGTAPRQLIACTDIAVPDAKVGLDTVGIVGFDATDPTSIDAIGLAGTTDIAYESTDNLYLVASPAYPICIDICMLHGPLDGPAYDAPVPSGSTQGGTSYLFDFALNGDRAVHVASGEVEGRIDDRWSMDEAGGVLRVAVTPTAETGDFTSVVTLHKLGQNLVQLGRIDRLGPGEQLQAVRWFDDLAIVVTYRRLDPMFAIDLSHPSRPRLLGKLRIPGFSSYLHPLGARRMIGVGTGPGGNTQVGLFDTQHLRHLRRLDAVHFRRTDPLAASDPRAFTWVQESRTALTVIERWGASRVGYLATLAVRRGQLISHVRQVEYGNDVTQVRAVPVGGGRVVLVTGEDARFLHLAPKP